jgi:hypothetical protein
MNAELGHQYGIPGPCCPCILGLISTRDRFPQTLFVQKIQIIAKTQEGLSRRPMKARTPQGLNMLLFLPLFSWWSSGLSLDISKADVTFETRDRRGEQNLDLCFSEKNTLYLCSCYKAVIELVLEDNQSPWRL